MSNPWQSWHPAVGDDHPLLIIDFNDTIRVASLKVRGSVNNETGNQEYVTTFTFEYYDDANGTWDSVMDDDGEVKTFVANKDGVTVDTAKLEVPVSTKVCYRNYLSSFKFCTL